VLDIKTVNEEQTKYNENTGKPYKVKVPSHDVALVNGIVVLNEKDKPGATDVGAVTDGLEVVESGFENGVRILGAILALAGEYRSDWSRFDAIVPTQVKTFAKKHGLTPKFYLVQSCG
jgi:hypothetical protein